ncbi:hypothetical protein ACFSFW_10475 [Fredinandcohnia salidurans]|uniref:Uncharacterized protein n=1 Tax=Fredinandcohnia salidurans TaxID=2595041 RepID=A0ABW4MNY5_9BACI
MMAPSPMATTGTTVAFAPIQTFLPIIKVEDIKEDNDHAYFHFYDPSGKKLQVHW